MKNKLLLVVFGFLALTVASVDVYAASISHAKCQKFNLFLYKRQNQETRFRLCITIADWKVDPSDRRAVVWGQTTDTLPMGETPYAKYYILDLEHQTVLGEYSTTRGPFEVEFSEKTNRISIDDAEFFFDTGAVAP